MTPPSPSRGSPPWQLWIALGCMVLGFMAGLQLRLPPAGPDLQQVQEDLRKTREEVRVLRKQLREAREAAALEPVQGPGVEVVLEDSSNQPTPGEDPYDFVVHDVDLLALTNELWASGAEAVAVDGIRLGTGSSIRCVGPTVLVDGRRVAAPYRVQAVGPPGELEAALKMPGGFVASMERLVRAGGLVEVSRRERLDLPARRATSGTSR